MEVIEWEFVLLDYVSPSRAVEGIISKYVKAIVIVETWKTEDKFLEEWNNRIFKTVGEKLDERFVYLGWTMNVYLGWNMDHSKWNEKD
jgi:hypothetical protein